MKSTDVLRNLIRTMGSGNPELDEALRISVLAYLDKLDPPEAEQKDEKPEQKDEKPEQKPEKTSAPKKKKNSLR